MDFENQAGRHGITVRLRELATQVHELIITMSAYAGATLADIVQPYVKIVDSSSQVG